MSDVVSKLTKVDDASNYALQVCGKHCGIDDTKHGYIIYKDMITEEERKILLNFIKKQKYTHIDENDQDCITPYKLRN